MFCTQVDTILSLIPWTLADGPIRVNNAINTCLINPNIILYYSSFIEYF